jgi:hypothetical protein
MQRQSKKCIIQVEKQREALLKIRYLIGLVLVGGLAACAHDPHKAEKIDTKLTKDQAVSGSTAVGVHNGNAVVQTKVAMSEELRRLQYEVYELEDHVYGNRKYGSLGLYGNLRDCRLQLSDKKNGGTGKLIWTEPMDRITDKEEEFKIGVDENEKLVGVSEEFLSDRIARFRGYKTVLMKREDDFDDKLAICRAELRSRQFDADHSEPAAAPAHLPARPAETPADANP